MKISLTRHCVTPFENIDLERSDKYFSKETWDYWNKPLDIYDFRIGKNSKGQLVVNFHSKNHKYFKIESSYSSSADENEIEDNCSEYGSRGISIGSTDEVFEKGDDYELPVMRSMLILTPETQEEDDLLNGNILRLQVLPLKWEYAITFLTWEDYDIVDWEGEPVKIEQEMIEFFGT